nr:flagellin lysine-N-methylase [uncultured Blautia sp.]
MHYKKPQYYDNFTCIADRCPDICCAGWQIVIDDTSLENYGKISGTFGERLQKSIDWEEGIFRQNQRRCAFLNQENLCDLYRELGADSLCDTCRMYPRHVEEYEDLREFSLSLSCPVAAEMILGCKEQVRFLEEEDDVEEQEEEYEDFDIILFDWLEEAREVLLEVIQDRSLPVSARMLVLLNVSFLSQKALDQGILLEMDLRAEVEKAVSESRKTGVQKQGEKVFQNKILLLKDLQKLEVLREEWTELLHRLEKNLYARGVEDYEALREEFLESVQETSSQKKQWEIYEEQLLVFFVYTYFCGAVYDDMIYTKAVLAVFSVLWIEELWMERWLSKGKKLEFQDMVQAAYTYAREIEHSDENLNLLEEFFDTRTVYYPEKMEGIIRYQLER